MRNPLKIVARSAGTVVILFVALVSPKVYPGVFPKVWGATVTVDGNPSNGSSLYLNRWGLLVRHGSKGREMYVFAGDDERGWVWKCEASTISVLPGVALSSNERVKARVPVPASWRTGLRWKAISEAEIYARTTRHRTRGSIHRRRRQEGEGRIVKPLARPCRGFPPPYLHLHHGHRFTSHS
jgi:hypothetical protein